MTEQAIEHQTVKLVPNGPEIPALGVGTWSWGDTLFWQYGKTYGASDVQQAFAVSLAAGVNFFDTAEVYGLGKSEEAAGAVYPDGRDACNCCHKVLSTTLAVFGSVCGRCIDS